MTGKKTEQAENPWIAKSIFRLMEERAIVAEACVKDLLNVIDPGLLDRHNGDYVAAVAEITNG